MKAHDLEVTAATLFWPVVEDPEVTRVAIGTLCVADFSSRASFTEEQLVTLSVLFLFVLPLSMKKLKLRLAC